MGQNGHLLNPSAKVLQKIEFANFFEKILIIFFLPRNQHFIVKKNFIYHYMRKNAYFYAIKYVYYVT